MIYPNNFKNPQDEINREELGNTGWLLNDLAILIQDEDIPRMKSLQIAERILRLCNVSPKTIDTSFEEAVIVNETKLIE